VHTCAADPVRVRRAYILQQLFDQLRALRSSESKRRRVNDLVDDARAGLALSSAICVQDGGHEHTVLVAGKLSCIACSVVSWSSSVVVVVVEG
jgi:hypothetical protein